MITYNLIVEYYPYGSCGIFISKELKVLNFYLSYKKQIDYKVHNIKSTIEYYKQKYNVNNIYESYVKRIL